MASSSILVGNRNEISARMFAEYVAAKKGKIAMVSVYLDKLTEMDAQIILQETNREGSCSRKERKAAEKA